MEQYMWGFKAKGQEALESFFWKWVNFHDWNLEKFLNLRAAVQVTMLYQCQFSSFDKTV